MSALCATGPGASASALGGGEVLAGQPQLLWEGAELQKKEFLDLESWDPLAGRSKTPGNTKKMKS